MSLIQKLQSMLPSLTGVKGSEPDDKRRKIHNATAIPMLVVFLCVAASAYWFFQANTTAGQQQLDKLAQQQADQRVKFITTFIKKLQVEIDKLAHREVLMRTLGREDKPSDVFNLLRTTFPKIDTIRLLDLERADHLPFLDANKTSTPFKRLGFTELDMIYRAEQGAVIYPEVKKVDKTWQLLFVTAISESPDAPVAGTLLLSFPGNLFIKNLGAIAPELGSTQLLRESQRKPVPLFSVGSGDVGPVIEKTVPNSVWKIRFKPSYALQQHAQKSIFLVMAFHIVVGAVLLWVTYWISGFFDPSRRVQHQQQVEPLDPSTHYDTDEEEALRNLLLAAEDENVLGMSEKPNRNNQTAVTVSLSDDLPPLPEEIFRAYDIRGIAHEQISEDIAELIGKSIGTTTLVAGDNSIFVARDGRLHSEDLSLALIQGILSTGCNVINLGVVPTPLLYFATCELPQTKSGVMVTASHNPAQYNGFKMVINGTTLFDDAVQAIKQRIEQQDFYLGDGEASNISITDAYVTRILSDVALSGSVKLVIDAGNGVTGDVAPLLFEKMGCDVERLYCDIDGHFPNHPPDPTIADNLKDLITRVKLSDADLGIALDGDGDRVVVVTPKGKIIWPDRMLMLFAKDIITRNPGTNVIFDVKSTRALNDLVSDYGGNPIMWKSGHSHMKNKMLETGALVGGELSGHIFIKDRWYGFDDGMYAAARLLEIMTLRDQNIDALFESFQTMPSTPEILIPIAETMKFKVIKRLAMQGNFENGTLITIDGLRVDFPKGWGLVRASNTSAALTVRFEAENEKIIEQLKQLFRRELLKIDNSLKLPF